MPATRPPLPWATRRRGDFLFSDFYLVLRRSRRRPRRFTPATLTGVAGRPMRASASVAVTMAAGTARLAAAARPTREKACRREIISDLIFSPITASCSISKLRPSRSKLFFPSTHQAQVLRHHCFPAIGGIKSKAAFRSFAPPNSASNDASSGRNEGEEQLKAPTQ